MPEVKGNGPLVTETTEPVVGVSVSETLSPDALLVKGMTVAFAAVVARGNATTAARSGADSDTLLGFKDMMSSPEKLLTITHAIRWPAHHTQR